MSSLTHWAATGISFDLIFIIPVLFIFVRIVQYVMQSREKNLPPQYGGFIPWIGCALEFGKEPLLFIEKIRKKLGPVFTLKVTGKRLSFVTEVEDFHHFFSSTNLDFQTAVQKPVLKTANVNSESFYKYHTIIHDTVKGRFAPNLLPPINDDLCQSFTAQMEEWGDSGQVNLPDLVRKTMYVSVLEHIFGKGTLPTKEGFKDLDRHFVKFDGDFEYGSQMPEFLLKDWSKSKWWLLKVFCDAVLRVEKKETERSQETVFQTLIRLVDREHAPNYGLLLMWASLANAIPMTFWTLAFILTNPEVLSKIQEELTSVLGPKNSGRSGCSINLETLNKLPYVRWCVLESIRLRSPGVITRAVTTSFTIRGYTIPEGDQLMMSPYWAHRNPQLFPQPEAFKPERWSDTDPEKNLYIDGFVAFGGGRYQCPGRWFALMEIQLFVALVLHHFHVEPLDPLPPCSPLHVVGTQQPDGPFTVSYSRRK